MDTDLQQLNALIEDAQAMIQKMATQQSEEMTIDA